MIYFDSAASTLPCVEALEAFRLASTDIYANPSSAHAFGRLGARKLDEARKKVLDVFGVGSTHQAIFLSGATEGNNLALKGVALSYANRGKKILVSSVEHPSVTEPCKYLESLGFEIVKLPVNEKGVVEPETLERCMDKDVILVSVMGVNNETGAKNDLEALAKIVHRYPKAFFHSDLTQAIGKVDVSYANLDLFTFSAHKIHGIKGVGALVMKKNIRPVPSSHGGGQEYGFRSGTESLPLAESLLAALQRAASKRAQDEAHARELWDALYVGLQGEEVHVNSTRDGSPFVFNFSLLKHRASVIVEALSQKEIYVSSLSACSSRTDKASPTLQAMGLREELCANAIRVSFDESNTLEEVETFLAVLKQLLKEVHPR